MTARRMLEAVARLEGWTYSESYDIPDLAGFGSFSDIGLYSILEDLDSLDGKPPKRMSLEEKRQRLLESYFESSGSKPREAVLLAAEAIG